MAAPPLGSAATATKNDVVPPSMARRKANGIFYTPPRLADLLVRWALARCPDRVLEPAFGDGVFLEAAHHTLSDLGVLEPGPRLFGVEIDPDGPLHLLKRGLVLPEGNLHHGDLLALDADQLNGPFGAIVGNPPYIRHHALKSELTERGRRSGQRLGIDLNGRSDAWAYFCAHLVTFLAPGGRLALVLPGSILHAEYAEPLFDALATEKGEVQLVRITKRLFPQVQERTVILLIDRGRPSGPPIYRRIANLKGLAPALRQPLRRKARSAQRARHDPRLPWRLTSSQAAAWEEVCAHPGVDRLGEIARIRIGVVTGANSFFVRSVAEADRLGKSVQSVPIVPRGAWLKRPRWNAEAQAEKSGEPSRLLLFPESTMRLSKIAAEELRRAEGEEIDKRSHCDRRSPWFKVRDSATPQIFLPYMGSAAPRLVTNEAAATCTNAIHRVWLESGVERLADSIAASSWTTLYRVSAELSGRSYGGGILKLEPNGAVDLRLPPADSSMLDEIVEAFELGGVDMAREVADRKILVAGMGITRSDLDRLRTAADSLEALRRH